MKRIEYFELLAKTFEFKTIIDDYGNEFVLLKENCVDSFKKIEDKTEFEASENHIHLLDNINKNEFEILKKIAPILGQAVLHSLTSQYAQKHFRVYVSIHLYDSMIIRFHQKWDNEEFYCNPDEFTSSKEKVYAFENNKA